MGHKLSKNMSLTVRDLDENSKKKVDQELSVTFIHIKMQFINGLLYPLYIDSQLTCGQLKILLHSKISETLEPNKMILQIMRNNQRLRIREHEVLGNILILDEVVFQEKIPPSELSNVSFNSSIFDTVTSELGGFETPCGHQRSRNCLIKLVKQAIKNKNYRIICPQEDCYAEFSYQYCSKLGCFTQEEHKQYSNGLSQQWLFKNTKTCKGCSSFISISDKRCGNKVSCPHPKCRNTQYCYLCLQPWRNPSQKVCGNSDCLRRIKNFNEVGTRKMRLFKRDIQSWTEVEIPQRRICPVCDVQIQLDKQDQSGCKHMKCRNCLEWFCFTCLQVAVKGSFSCGKYDSYCGNVAERQKLI